MSRELYPGLDDLKSDLEVMMNAINASNFAKSIENLAPDKRAKVAVTKVGESLAAPPTQMAGQRPQPSVPLQVSPPVLVEEEKAEQGLLAPKRSQPAQEPQKPSPILGVPKRNSIISVSDTHLPSMLPVSRGDNIPIEASRESQQLREPPKSQTNLAKSTTLSHSSAGIPSMAANKIRNSHDATFQSEVNVNSRRERRASAQKETSGNTTIFSGLTRSLMESAPIKSVLGLRRSSAQPHKSDMPSNSKIIDSPFLAARQLKDETTEVADSEHETQELDFELDFSDYRLPFVMEKQTQASRENMLQSPVPSSASVPLKSGKPLSEFDAYLQLGKLKRGYLPQPQVHVPIRISSSLKQTG